MLIDARVKAAVKARLDSFAEASQDQSYIVVRSGYDEVVFEVQRYAHGPREWSWAATAGGEHLVIGSKRFPLQIERGGVPL